MRWFGFLFLLTRFHGLFPFYPLTRLHLRCVSPRNAYCGFPPANRGSFGEIALIFLRVRQLGILHREILPYLNL
jgi:hypothetical protein